MGRSFWCHEASEIGAALNTGAAVAEGAQRPANLRRQTRRRSVAEEQVLPHDTVIEP
jgi:hypothetical protein